MKAALRKELAVKRSAITVEDWSKRSLAICEAIVKLPSWPHWKKIALYESFRNEVDLRPLIRLAPDRDYYFPKISALNGTMEFFLGHDLSKFQRNSWGLLEPDGLGEALAEDDQTLIIVPALAYDLAGHRLGYGKGFYDRFLNGKKISTIGVCFSEFLIEQLPSETHDQPVSELITEDGPVLK
ncbi:MAG: 5-formyltetrahydrofolate cyclo-ligase [Proteobacteria bacterium]|nr:MAG: 5-formyltetrahydrofolate cyclo-ligase [Pseudomonadota bacterium]